MGGGLFDIMAGGGGWALLWGRGRLLERGQKPLHDGAGRAT